MSLAVEQAKAAYAVGSVSVTAGAGTGKTHMLAERYLYHLQSGYSPLEIVAVTFTEKAAAELRSRVRQTILQQAPEQEGWIAEVEAAPISTFHALAARICREQFEAANVPADFRLLDDLEGKLWRVEQLAIALDELTPDVYANVPYSLMRVVLEAFLDDPLNAAAALNRTRTDWLPEVERCRQVALDNLLKHPTWIQARQVLDSCAGAVGDKLESTRQTAIAGISSLEQGEDVLTALTAIDKLNLQGGSQKNWSSKELLEEVKAAIKALRETVREVLKAGLITLQVTELDDQIESMQPVLQMAFEQVQAHLREAKRQQRVLDFNDLEVHALKALERPEVREYYAKRWRVFLIDEFQDTNPIQGQFLEQLTAQAILTLVGDEKQSIYGFRRADVRVFQEWRDRLQALGGEVLSLTQSFRTHQPLIHNINTLFAPVLEELHQNLDAKREAPHEGPHLEVFAVTPGDIDPKPKIEQCRSVEAQHIADVVERLLKEQVQVWDKPTRSLRAIQPGDIAVLSRTWDPLEGYGQAIESRGIPILQAGGGNLLETREAKDAVALLQFLADPSDDLALVTCLRSPFFAVSDRTLLTLSQLPAAKTWWQRLKQSNELEIKQVVETLHHLLREREAEPPTRLLQLADRLTGYTAVIANLPGCDRRLADWRGFLDVVRQLELGMADVLVVVRRLKRLINYEVSIPRPALAASNSVALMTIHAAKGLEWSVVIVPDLTRQSASSTASVRFDPDLGVSLKLEDEAGEKQKSALYIVLEQQQKQQDAAEAKRLLYVALTRARDRLILTAAEPSGNGLSILQPGLEGQFPIQPIPFDFERVTPGIAVEPSIPQIPPTMLVNSTQLGGLELPVTALTAYARCPKQFRLQYIDGHPGLKTGASNRGAEIGSLTHRALEKNISSLENLHQYQPDLPTEQVQEALDLANVFWRSPTYQPVRHGDWEYALQLSVGLITLNGSADLVGADFVLDIKTDQAQDPEDYRFQLWAYAKATQKTKAHIAFLRHDTLHTFASTDLQTIGAEVNELVHEGKSS
uniref:DNA 3'-5' helicase n=1 Tax=Oscillatoriales cyanobacterium SpSt-418 TaxID=2282169 RepID=A0A7C3KHC7_9CYAN